MTALIRKLLVVDDAETCADIIEMALAGIPGLEVEWAGSAEAGLELLRNGDVAALITDLELPGMNGLELLSEVRHLPVIVVSATTDPTAEATALASGASAFFQKPFSPAAIRRKIEEVLKEGAS
ncbi:MAG: hypothetical protein RL328_39 [Acidobacteriota bacterium]|jgi:DNA-binding response OmpR family regulator